MTSAGLLPGLNQDGWRRYEPKLVCAGTGGETQPAGITEGASLSRPPFGRYLIVDHQYVQVEQQFAIRSVSAIGVGSAYVMSLPFPANRWTGEGQPSPVPLGLGMCYFSDAAGAATNANMPTTITLADPFPSLAGQEDSFVQAYCQYILSWGGPVTISGTTTTVTHQCGYAPRAEDIEVILEVTTTAASAWAPIIQNITTTTFDVVFRATPTGSPTFSWKVRGKPPQAAGSHGGALMSPTTPWDWTRVTGTVQGNIFMQFSYEARR